MDKNKVLGNWGYIVCCAVSYIIVTSLMDLLFFDTAANCNWLETAVKGVMFAVVMFLFRLYEENKNIK